ncbi:hypothetical protein WG66_014480 [Moniliophthora roreri]|nr:hypothetical protein WG66_014480 [Moniliophthora roreri]
MDSATIQTPSTLSTPTNRKRKYENETPSQRIKREKAAERQRRKRERDRNAHLGIVAPPAARDYQQNQHPIAQGEELQAVEYEDMTPEEAARRERVRAAARERQRKHRALVKQRKMQELGMDMGNEVGVDGLTYPEGAYQLSDMQQPPPPGNPVDPQTGEPAFPRAPHGNGGQMFATTLLLSFSCAPLLKQHLLDTLQMSNDELASLEPVIAEAWDQWDRQRRQPFDPQNHYDQSASNTSATTTTSTTSTSSNSTSAFPHLAAPGASPSETAAAAIAAVVTPDFRARFHRSILAPTPFQAQAAAAAAQAGVGTGSPVPSGGGAIDPHLSGEAKEES